MTIKLSIVLDHKIDIFREINICSNSTLLTLHKYIVEIFNLEKNEMAAFYHTDDDWEQGQEIPLVSMRNNEKEMKDLFLCDIFTTKQRLLYINNFLLMWRFMIDVIEVDEKNIIKQPMTVLSFGTLPEESPNIQFITDIDNFSEDDDLYDDGFDEFNEFENYEGY